MNKRCAIKERNFFFFLSSLRPILSSVVSLSGGKNFFADDVGNEWWIKEREKIGQSLDRLITRSSVYAPYLFSIFSSSPPFFCPTVAYKIHKKDDSQVFLTLRRSNSVASATKTLRNSKSILSPIKLFPIPLKSLSTYLRNLYKF